MAEQNGIGSYLILLGNITICHIFLFDIAQGNVLLFKIVLCSILLMHITLINVILFIFHWVRSYQG